MKWLTVLVACALLVPVGLPAGSASPPAGRVARLERQVETLRSRVERLRSQVRALARANASSLRSAHALARLAAGSSGCPVTAPNNSEPPGSTFGSVFHGNGSLWVGMWDANVVVWPPEPDGSVEAKFGWWRGVAGTLRIEGRRLDASAPALVSRVPDGYGATGFQSTALLFPSAGCWEVTGRVGPARLTFVTLVVAV
jgi:outer membrane murein-binding lipoprotein Lpp